MFLTNIRSLSIDSMKWHVFHPNDKVSSDGVEFLAMKGQQTTKLATENNGHMIVAISEIMMEWKQFCHPQQWLTKNIGEQKEAENISDLILYWMNYIRAFSTPGRTNQA